MNVRLPAVTRLVVVCASLLVIVQAQAAKHSSPPAQENKPILGFVFLNKTTLGEFVEKLVAQGCAITYDNGMAQVDAGCVELPGSPKIRAITSLKEGDEAVPWESLQSVNKLPTEWANLTIESLALYTRDYKAWKNYLESLSNSWGKPTSLTGSDGSSGSTATWKRNELDVELKRLSGYTWLTYVSKDRQKKLEEYKLAQKKIKQQNLDLL